MGIGHARGVYVLSVPVLYVVTGGSGVDCMAESARISGRRYTG